MIRNFHSSELSIEEKYQLKLSGIIFLSYLNNINHSFELSIEEKYQLNLPENHFLITFDIQLCHMNVIPLLSKPYVNEVTLREQK